MEERLTLAQAAALFDPPKTRKAVEQLVQRGNLRAEKDDPDPTTGRARRRWTTRAWLEEYAESTGGKTTVRPSDEQALVVARTPLSPAPAPAPNPGAEAEPLRRVLGELAQENLQLKLRVAELETQLARR
jgi:hypothetical protein